VQNPKKLITIRIETASIDYFKKLAEETGISYQNLINLFLSDCAKRKKKPNVRWSAFRAARGRRGRPVGRTARRNTKKDS
jgi:hypothetical protein